MQNSLLAHIASNFISEYENVANSSVCYLLNQYPTARQVLKTVLQLNEIPSHFATELATKENGRPDITGLDKDGNKQVIIEGKFWANLTKNQPDNYLKIILENGKILFLAPDKRIESLKSEIKERLNDNNDNIVVCSWLDFLSQIERENNKEHNYQLASDLLQIKELCQKMDSEGMPPLSASDLDPMNGRISYQLTDIIDDCNTILRQWEYTTFKGLKATSTKYGYGFYFEAFDFGCRLYFSNHKWSVREAKTPFWLKIQEEWGKSSQKVKSILKELKTKNAYEDSVGIKLQTGMDKEQAVNHIVTETKAVLIYLHEKIT